MPDVELNGDISHILTHLGNLVSDKPPAARVVTPAYNEMIRDALESHSDDGFPVKPQRVLRDLRALMRPNDLLISDVGAHKLWISRLWPAHEPNTVLISNGAAAMGFARAGGGGRAHGAAQGPAGRHHLRRRRLPDERAGAGDGQAAGAGDRQHRLVGQRLRRDRDAPAPQVRRAWPGPSSTNPDLVALAESFGIAGMRVGAADEVTPTLQRALELDGPSVVEIPIDYRENAKFSMIWPTSARSRREGLRWQ